MSSVRCPLLGEPLIFTPPVLVAPEEFFIFLNYPSKFLIAPTLALNTKQLYNERKNNNRQGDAQKMTRQELINAIMELLKKADRETLQLIWITARNLTK